MPKTLYDLIPRDEQLSNDVLLGAIRESLQRSRVALDRELGERALRNCYTSLTPRERQVMALVVSGLLNKQVGGELGISEITVKAHRGQVMQKMKANSLADLVRMAARLRLTDQARHLDEENVSRFAVQGRPPRTHSASTFREPYARVN